MKNVSPSKVMSVIACILVVLALTAVMLKSGGKRIGLKATGSLFATNGLPSLRIELANESWSYYLVIVSSSDRTNITKEVVLPKSSETVLVKLKSPEEASSIKLFCLPEDPAGPVLWERIVERLRLSKNRAVAYSRGKAFAVPLSPLEGSVKE